MRNSFVTIALLIALSANVSAKDEPVDLTEIKATFKDGLKLKSADGNFEAHIGGRFIQHMRFVTDRPDSSRTSADNFFVRQARLEMSGTFYKDFEFKVQTDFPQGSSTTSGTLQDAYIGWKKYKEFSIRFGQQKEPFSQEETTSTRFIDFVERSNVNKLTPGRDVGIMLHGTLASDIALSYEAGIFNGQGRAVNDGNDEKDLAARLRVSPFLTSDNAVLNGLRLGIAGTWGDQDGTDFSDLSTTETVTKYLDVDSGVSLEGMRTRRGAELSWLYESLGVRAEYFTVVSQVIEGAVKGGIDAQAWYWAVTYLLTGEKKTLENRLKPANPFNIDTGDIGAVELAARVAGVRFDSDVFTKGFASEAGNSNDVVSYTIGVNWYLNTTFRVIFDYIIENYGDNVLTGNSAFDDQTAFMARFQMDF